MRFGPPTEFELYERPSVDKIAPSAAGPEMITCDKEAIKILVVLHGQRKTARIAALSKNAVKSWARYGWNTLPQTFPHPAHPIRT